MNMLKQSGLLMALVALTAFMITISSCADDETGIFDGFVTFQADNLFPIENQVYKLWLYDGEQFSFVADLSPNSLGHIDSTEYMDVDRTFLDEAKTMAVSIDADVALEAPVGPIIIAGDFAGEMVSNMTVSHPIAIGDPFFAHGGEFDLLSPSTSNMSDSTSGIWFYDTSRVDSALLNLPEINETWTYEAWLDFGDDIILSMGRFATANQADSSSFYSGAETTLNFPGEDFINNLPTEISTPVDVRGHTLFITLEPSVDFDPAPFDIRLLSAIIPDIDINDPLAMSSIDVVFPRGSGSR